jgi:hypothetical protein
MHTCVLSLLYMREAKRQYLYWHLCDRALKFYLQYCAASSVEIALCVCVSLPAAALKPYRPSCDIWQGHDLATAHARSV